MLNIWNTKQFTSFLSNYLNEIWDIQEQDLLAYGNSPFETYPGNSKVVANAQTSTESCYRELTEIICCVHAQTLKTKGE